MKTDNDEHGFNQKVSLRLESIKGLKDIAVLDCFHGHGHIWNEVKRKHEGDIKVLGIDIRSDKTKSYLKGDNRKYLMTMDLSRFKVIDVDAYGSPYNILKILFQRQYRGIVHATFIASGMGRINTNLLLDLGYTKEMIEKCPTMLSQNHFEKLCNWLSMQGLKSVNFLSINRKFYLYFQM